MTRTYDVEIGYYDAQGKYVKAFEYVTASNRNQAIKIMERRGYEVRSVSMA